MLTLNALSLSTRLQVLNLIVYQDSATIWVISAQNQSLYGDPSLKSCLCGSRRWRLSQELRRCKQYCHTHSYSLGIIELFLKHSILFPTCLLWHLKPRSTSLMQGIMLNWRVISILSKIITWNEVSGQLLGACQKGKKWVLGWAQHGTLSSNSNTG